MADLTIIDNTNDRLSRVVMAGFMATLVSLLVGRVCDAVGFADVDFAKLYGSFISGNKPVVYSGLWWWGITVHLLVGTVVLPLLFSFLKRFNIKKTGLTFGLLLWVAYEGILKPLSPDGFFSSHDSRPILTSLSFLVTWLAYGLVIEVTSRRKHQAEIIRFEDRRAA